MIFLLELQKQLFFQIPLESCYLRSTHSKIKYLPLLRKVAVPANCQVKNFSTGGFNASIDKIHSLNVELQASSLTIFAEKSNPQAFFSELKVKTGISRKVTREWL